ncbi:MAG: response regulator [Planctomycetes bacterium]|nr:response regulator [Planctomycetota bacterium]
MEGVKILIVDDDTDITDSPKAILEDQQFSVVTASDRVEGMEKFKAESPDLVILDVMMDTWQDGFEMAREIKGEPEFKDIPILMLTGVQDKSGIDFKSTAGDPTWLPVDGFLDKPVDAEVLIAEVEKLLAKA